MSQAPPSRRRISRRVFLVSSAAVVGAGGLAVGVVLQRRGGAPARLALPADAPAAGFRPNAYLHIGSDGGVTLVSHLTEMGQGIKTALPMLIAEELEVDWRRVRVRQGDLDHAYGAQFTGASGSITRHYEEFRRLGATARTMLVNAAAAAWQVPASQCTAAGGTVRHPASGRSLSYGELAERAAAQPVPGGRQARLKAPQDFRLIGTRVSGVDNTAIVTGAPLFGIDVSLPGMCHASYAKCPKFGGKVARANLDAVKAMPGVIDAFVIDGGSILLGLLPGVAIVADSTWTALKARRALEVQWTDPPGPALDAAAFEAEARRLAGQPAQITARRDGDAETALAGAARVLEAWYAYPFIAHATMEPMNCSAHFKDGVLEIWAPTQTPVWARDQVASTLNVPADRIRIHPLRCGGGFGRRLSNDYVLEAAAIAMRVQRPVKLTWSREDDLQHDHYRGGGFHRLRGGLDAQGRVVGWHHRYIGYGVDGGASDTLGAHQFPGRWLQHCTMEQSTIEAGIPTGAWRAPADNVFAWVIQSFVDELAAAAGRDALDFRLELLGPAREMRSAGVFSRTDYDVGRARGVLEAAARHSGWRTPLPPGRGRGIAFHHSYGGYVAQVVEASVTQERLRIERVVCVCDVGSPIVNLSGAEAQVQGSILDGLSAALLQEIRFEGGRIAQSNFHDYPLLRIGDVPRRVEVHFLQTDHPPSGLGEPALPPFAPALYNAIHAATGRRLRQMPLAAAGMRMT